MSKELISIQCPKKGIYLLTFHAGENRFNKDFVDEFHKALDKVENANDSIAMITTGDSKFYSNGLDLKWASQNPSPTIQIPFMKNFFRLLNRILVFSIPTLALLNGHCYAAGLMLAMAHDFRVMKSDRGWICLPAVELGLTLPKPLLEILRRKMQINVFRDALLTGRKYTGEEALKAGLVDSIATKEEELLSQSLHLLEKFVPRPKESYGESKRIVFEDLTELFLNPNEKTSMNFHVLQTPPPQNNNKSKL